MKKLFTLPVVFLFLTINLSCQKAGVITSSATGTVYYVKTGGSNSNTGLSDAQAWATVSKVNGSTFQPGDYILFNGGNTWNESLIVPNSGTAGRHITFGRYGTGANPIFDGQNTRTDCISIEGISYITINGIDTKNATEFGVVAYDWNHLGSHDFIVENCTASYNAQGGICLYIDNCSAINCIAHHNGTLSTHHGINIEGHISSDGLVTADNWLITGCTSYNNAGYGFQSYVGGGGTLSYCKAYLNGSTSQSGGGAIISTVTTGKTVNVYYNIFYSNIFYGIQVADNTAGTAINIYNNTLYDNDDVTYGAGIILKENNSVSSGMIKVKNNLILQSRSLDFEQTENTTPYSISNNLYYRTSGNMIYWNSVEYTQAQFSTYKTASGDVTSLSANPTVTNAAGYDFSLQVGSPCINAGVSVGLTRDYLGNLITGLPDIGALEKQ
jgi:parallel beta-helix repeat protein